MAIPVFIVKGLVNKYTKKKMSNKTLLLVVGVMVMLALLVLVVWAFLATSGRS
jgi:hypothetical protein